MDSKKKTTEAVGNTTAAKAVLNVTQGENIVTPPKVSKFSWNEFFHLSLTWVFSAFTVALVLFVATLYRHPEKLFYDLIVQIDTLSLMFSLVLSAALEQVWNNKQQLRFKITQFLELALAVFGLVWYLSYSIDESINQLVETPAMSLSESTLFAVHLGYIIISVIVVMVGFVIRSFENLEDN